MKSLDEEHLEILNSLKRLSGLLDNANFKAEPVKAAFGALIALLETHFINEEKWMKGFSYSGLDTHKEQHEKLILTLTNFFKEFSADPTQSLGKEFYNLAKDLLSFHAVQADSVSARNALQTQRSYQP